MNNTLSQLINTQYIQNEDFEHLSRNFVLTRKLDENITVLNEKTDIFIFANLKRILQFSDQNKIDLNVFFKNPLCYSTLTKYYQYENFTNCQKLMINQGENPNTKLGFILDSDEIKINQIGKNEVQITVVRKKDLFDEYLEIAPEIEKKIFKLFGIDNQDCSMPDVINDYSKLVSHIEYKDNILNKEYILDIHRDMIEYSVDKNMKKLMKLRNMHKSPEISYVKDSIKKMKI